MGRFPLALVLTIDITTLTSSPILFGRLQINIASPCTRSRIYFDPKAYFALAAMISTSTRNSGRTNCGTTRSIDAGRASPTKRVLTAA